MTFVVYNAQPCFPATDQNPNSIRYQVGNLWVDTDSPTPPMQADIDAAYAPVVADAARIAAVKANNRRKTLVAAIQASDDAALIAAVAARYPGLTGDSLKAVTDLALLVAAAIRA